MSHLKKSEGKLTETKIQKEDGTEAKSILKTTIKSDKIENKKSKVKFKETQDDSESESEDDNIYDDNLSEEDENLDEGGSSNEDDLNESEKVQYSMKRKRNESELHLDEESDENEEFSSSDDDNDDDFEEDVTESLISDENEEQTDLSLKEDIYGRLRDSEGNIVTKATGSYVPPAKRFALADTMDEKNKLKVERLKKQLKGLINRFDTYILTIFLLSFHQISIPLFYIKPHGSCNGYCARLWCGRSWVRTPIRSNQRL